MVPGASEEVLKESELSREMLQRSADAGQGRLLPDFISMHAAVMAKTCRGNRWVPAAASPSAPCT